MLPDTPPPRSCEEEGNERYVDGIRDSVGEIDLFAPAPVCGGGGPDGLNAV